MLTSILFSVSSCNLEYSLFFFSFFLLFLAEYYYHCPSDWEIFNDKCYKVVDETFTWPDARKHCRKIGGDLISIDSGTEQTFAENLLDAC